MGNLYVVTRNQAVAIATDLVMQNRLDLSHRFAQLASTLDDIGSSVGGLSLDPKDADYLCTVSSTFHQVYTARHRTTPPESSSTAITPFTPHPFWINNKPLPGITNFTFTTNSTPGFNGHVAPQLPHVTTLSADDGPKAAEAADAFVRSLFKS